MLEKSNEYQLAFENIITDDDKILETTFVILEKFICQMYVVQNSSNVNDVRFHLFSNDTLLEENDNLQDDDMNTSNSESDDDDDYEDASFL
ncbi:hypothetical protein HHI36_017394 [Cryptolaemus montrouzieri]|uniref:Uncharacterized protein n=1 Tax=Cryptolaemus montrouzieri TaxID=559131 RepID=A0ABD2NMD0_9CUCU